MNTVVNLELAKELKAEGFDRLCNNYTSERDGDYFSNGKQNVSYSNFNEIKNCYSRPTIAEVITWLYEKYGIWIVSLPVSKNKWYFEILYNYEKDIGWVCMNDSTEFNSPTEAYEAAIEYTLNNLI